MRVLIISEEEMSAGIRNALVAAPDVVFVGRCAAIDATRRHLAQDSPDIALLDLRLPDSLNLLESLAESSPATAPIVLVTADQMGQLQQALLAGARGFSLVPLTGDDLLATLRQVHAAELKRRQRQPSQAAGSDQVIAISGIKGGVGRTLIAVNLAVALAQKSGESVALLEGHASLGDIAPLLNVHPLHTLVDLVTEPSRLDADLIRGALVKHASGVNVLFAARTMEGGRQMTPELLAAALFHIRRIVRYVVVDTAPVVNGVLGEVLASADVVMVVTTPELPSLRRATLLLQAAQAEDLPVGKLRLVLNREGITGGVSRADIAQRLGVPIAFALPDDPALVAYSVNRGMPLVQSHPKSLLARRLRQLASQLVVTAQPDAIHPTREPVGHRTAIRLPKRLRLSLKPTW
jgi:pilus assembly protein CpaE